MLDATTITDEEIREARDVIRDANAQDGAQAPDVTVQIALGTSGLRHAARARCAEILNARAAKSEGR